MGKVTFCSPWYVSFIMAFMSHLKARGPWRPYRAVNFIICGRLMDISRIDISHISKSP